MKPLETIVNESDELFQKAEQPPPESVGQLYRLIVYNDSGHTVREISGRDNVSLAVCAFIMRGMLWDANKLIAQYSWNPKTEEPELLAKTASNGFAMLSHRYASRVAVESDQETLEDETKALIKDSEFVKGLTGISPSPSAYLHVLATLSALSSFTQVGRAAVQYLMFVFGSPAHYKNVVPMSTAIAKKDPEFEPTIQKLFQAVVTRDLVPSRSFVSQIQRLTGVLPVIGGMRPTADQYVRAVRHSKGLTPPQHHYFGQRK